MVQYLIGNVGNGQRLLGISGSTEHEPSQKAFDLRRLMAEEEGYTRVVWTDQRPVGIRSARIRN